MNTGDSTYKGGQLICPVCKKALLGEALRRGRDDNEMCERCYRDAYEPSWPPPAGVWVGPDGKPFCHKGE